MQLRNHFLKSKYISIPMPLDLKRYINKYELKIILVDIAQQELAARECFILFLYELIDLAKGHIFDVSKDSVYKYEVTNIIQDQALLQLMDECLSEYTDIKIMHTEDELSEAGVSSIKDICEHLARLDIYNSNMVIQEITDDMIVLEVEAGK